MSVSECVHMYVCVRLCVCACMHACMCVCVCWSFSVIVKCPALPACVVDKCSRNLLYYYYLFFRTLQFLKPSTLVKYELGSAMLASYINTSIKVPTARRVTWIYQQEELASIPHPHPPPKKNYPHLSRETFIKVRCIKYNMHSV